MPSGSIKTLADALLDWGCQGPDHTLRFIRGYVEKHPETLEELFPGMVLVKRPMTPSERARVSVPAMNVARRRTHAQRVRVVGPLIRKIRKNDPKATLGDIARALNAMDLPVRPSSTRGVWLDFDIARIIRDLERVDKSPPA